MGDVLGHYRLWSLMKFYVAGKGAINSAHAVIMGSFMAIACRSQSGVGCEDQAEICNDTFQGSSKYEYHRSCPSNTHVSSVRHAWISGRLHRNII